MGDSTAFVPPAARAHTRSHTWKSPIPFLERSSTLSLARRRVACLVAERTWLPGNEAADPVPFYNGNGVCPPVEIYDDGSVVLHVDGVEPHRPASLELVPVGAFRPMMTFRVYLGGDGDDAWTRAECQPSGADLALRRDNEPLYYEFFCPPLHPVLPVELRMVCAMNLESPLFPRLRRVTGLRLGVPPLRLRFVRPRPEDDDDDEDDERPTRRARLNLIFAPMV